MFLALPDLCKEMSTKGNDNVAAAKRDSAHSGAKRLPADIGFMTRARLELAYFSGYALIMQRYAGGAGIVLRF